MKDLFQRNTFVKEGTIVQIIDEKHDWFPCLLIISEILSWGVMGYITMPNNLPRTGRIKGENGNAFIRLTTDKFEIVGKANIVIK